MKDPNKIENARWELLAGYLTGEADEAARREVETWSGQTGENLDELNVSRQVLEKARLYYQTRPFDPAAAWCRVQAAIHPAAPSGSRKTQPAIRLFTPRLMKIAASVVLALALGTVGYYLGYQQRKTAVICEIAAADKQVLTNITLPDGTVVTLNSQSKLTHPKHFTGDTREVSIEGEAFFEVKPDAERPFVISAGKARIRVLGTSFNVCAYPETETVEVVVATGKVQVTSPEAQRGGASQVVLDPGEKGVLFNQNNQLVKLANDNPNVISWKTRELVFNQTPLSEVFQNLMKVYHIDIQVSDPALNTLVLTAHFNDQSIDFILEVIRLTFNLELSAQNGQYFFTSRNM